MTEPAVEAVDVCKRFGVTQALTSASLSVAAGEAHALVGRNGAGKSTLVGILTGVLRPDSGRVRFNGVPAPSPAARGEWQEQVACVYQKPTVVPWLTVVENLFLNAPPLRRFGRINWEELRRKARALLSEWGVDVDVDEPAFRLSVERRQLVEIVRALHQGARFVILDEPTAQLDAESVQRLFEHLKRLKRTGVTFLYISHHLSEIFGICDSVTVLRNGQAVLQSSLAGLSRADVVAAMVGDQALAAESRSRANRTPSGAEVALSVTDLRVGAAVGPVSFDVRRRECVGLAGQLNSGVLEIGRAIVGLEDSEGVMTVQGAPHAPRRPGEAVAAGVGFVPEDRHASGFVPSMSVTDNTTMAVWPRLSRWGILSLRAKRALSHRLISQLAIHAGEADYVEHLSGGNQQKVMIARALALNPAVLILLHPTAGVDIASKESLFEAIDDVRDAGCGTVIVSDEIDELAHCDRVLVVVHGRIVHEHAGAWEEETLIAQMEGAG